MVTVVDAYNFVHDYGSHDFLADRGETAGMAARGCGGQPYLNNRGRKSPRHKR
jgi:hypothetical protein